MEHFIGLIADKFMSSEQDSQALAHYVDMTKSKGWKVHQDILNLLVGLISEDLLSSKFTKLDAVEKDVKQRAYAEVVTMVRFLLYPLARIQRVGRIQRHNKAMEETLTGSTMRGRK